jgi:hypothetical protein
MPPGPAPWGGGSPARPAVRHDNAARTPSPAAARPGRCAAPAPAPARVADRGCPPHAPALCLCPPPPPPAAWLPDLRLGRRALGFWLSPARPGPWVGLARGGRRGTCCAAPSTPPGPPGPTAETRATGSPRPVPARPPSISPPSLPPAPCPHLASRPPSLALLPPSLPPAILPRSATRPPPLPCNRGLDSRHGA